MSLREGRRVFYIANELIFNSFVNKVYQDGQVTLRDGKFFHERELYLTKDEAHKALNNKKRDANA